MGRARSTPNHATSRNAPAGEKDYDHANQDCGNNYDLDGRCVGKLLDKIDGKLDRSTNDVQRHTPACAGGRKLDWDFRVHHHSSCRCSAVIRGFSPRAYAQVTRGVLGVATKATFWVGAFATVAEFGSSPTSARSATLLIQYGGRGGFRRLLNDEVR